MSKGSARRPQQVPDDAMSDSWSAIFERSKTGLKVDCRRCGKTGLPADDIHTCSPKKEKQNVPNE